MKRRSTDLGKATGLSFRDVWNDGRRYLTAVIVCPDREIIRAKFLLRGRVQEAVRASKSPASHASIPSALLDLVLVLKGEVSVEVTVRLQGLRVTEVENWQGQYLRAAENVLHRRQKDDDALKGEQIKKLQQKIGHLLLKNYVFRVAIKPSPFVRDMFDT